MLRMKVVIAPDSFKDAMRAEHVASHIAQGLRLVEPGIDIDCCPIADGGEGFVAAIARSMGGTAQRHQVPTVDPLERAIESGWLGLRGADGLHTAVIELAGASGLELLKPGERNVMLCSTLGTGRVMQDALKHGIDRLVLGIGGSATHDGGCGIAQALGARFYDDHGYELTWPITGSYLSSIRRIDIEKLDQQLKRCGLRVACDVTNPLTGHNGAAYTYAMQKGATAAQLEQLDYGLAHLARLWREQLGVDVELMPGAGAAGGVGGGLVAMLGAKLVPGAELVLDTVEFDRRVRGADLVITGEGRLDSQSLQGKAALAVARRSAQAGVPCYALVGCAGEGAERALMHGLCGYRVIGEGLDAADSILRTGELLTHEAAKLLQQLQSKP